MSRFNLHPDLSVRADVRGQGRSLAQIADAYGAPLPSTIRAGAAPSRHTEAGLVHSTGSKRGFAGRARGWSPVPHPLVVYRASTAEIGGVFPFVGAQALPPTGASVGVDTRSGAGFCVDPMGWVLSEITSNPNLVLFGKPGTGKSTTVKAILFRLMLFGVRTLVAGDVKDEYEKLARAVGVEPFALGVGMPARINPLDLGPLGAGWDSLSDTERADRARVIFGRWLVLLKALVGAQGVPTTAADEDALSAVLAQLTGWAAGSGQLRVITIPQVWTALRDPSDELAEACRYESARAMTDATRQVTSALGRWSAARWPGCSTSPRTSPSTGARPSSR
jgi:hypothetical protein